MFWALSRGVSSRRFPHPRFVSPTPRIISHPRISCDDAAVAIVNSLERRVLADRRSADSASLLRLGGVLPYASARHHRSVLGSLIEKALDDANLRSSDIDAVAVSTRPGLVYCLKVGVEHALAFASKTDDACVRCCPLVYRPLPLSFGCFRRPLVPVHHLRAHSLVARLLHPHLSFPFLTLIASGAHCLICSVHGPTKFYVLADSAGGSPGECLDKLAREMGLVPYKGSFAAQMERMARKCPADDVGRFALPLWSSGGQMDFDAVKCRYLRLLHRCNGWRNSETELAVWCACIQHTVTQLVCQHLGPALAFFTSTVPHSQCHLVVAGGVAANEHFRECVKNIAAQLNFADVLVLPRELCTDNGVMVAWTGVEMLAHALNESVAREKMDGKEKSEDGREEKDGKEKSEDEDMGIHWHIPDSILVSPRSQIGPFHEHFLQQKNLLS